MIRNILRLEFSSNLWLRAREYKAKTSVSNYGQMKHTTRCLIPVELAIHFNLFPTPPPAAHKATESLASGAPMPAPKTAISQGLPHYIQPVVSQYRNCGLFDNYMAHLSPVQPPGGERKRRSLLFSGGIESKACLNGENWDHATVNSSDRTNKG